MSQMIGVSFISEEKLFIDFPQNPVLVSSASTHTLWGRISAAAKGFSTMHRRVKFLSKSDNNISIQDRDPVFPLVLYYIEL